MTISQALANATTNLRTTGSTSPALDAEVLLSFVLQKDRAWLFAHDDQPLAPAQARRFGALVRRARQDWPIAYLTGTKEFFGRNFKVNRRVLIPRPETETLVETIISDFGQKQPAAILDIGTGSGCIAVTLARELKARIYASDVSARALAVARVNAKQHQAKISFKQSDLLAGWGSRKFDAIVANLPYLDKLIDPSTAKEPKSALLAGKKGLALIERLLYQVAARPDISAVYLEFGHNQARPVTALARRILPSWRIELFNDLAGVARFGKIVPNSRSKA